MSGIVQMLLGVGSGGGGSGSVTLTNVSVTALGSGVQSASYRIGNDGVVYTNSTGSYVAWETWTTDFPSNYEVRATVDAGDALTSGTVGSWLSCGTTRTWTDTSSTIGNIKSTTLLIEIRIASTGIVAASTYAYIYAERT